MTVNSRHIVRSAARSEYQTISKRAQSLLNRAEGLDVDFKQTVGGLKSEDLVAFANSLAGGSILLGVEEAEDESGRQRGRVIGCPVGDRERGSILSRAESCIPPVEIQIYAENLARTPFYRVEVPAGVHKPYSTSGGTYKIRGDGQNIPLQPTRLLAMFMETEGGEFLNRFRDATRDLEAEVTGMKGAVLSDIQELLVGLNALAKVLGTTFEEAANANALADDAMMYSGETLAFTEGVHKDVDHIHNIHLPDIEAKLDALLQHFSIENPIETQARAIARTQFEQRYERGARGWDLLHSIEFVRAPQVQIYKWYKQFLADTGRTDSELEKP